MKLTSITIYLCLLLLYFSAPAQTQQTGTEEYAYYLNGKKVELTPKQDEIFVTFATKPSLAKSKTIAGSFLKEIAKPEQADVFAPVNAVRYKVNAGQTGLAGSYGQVEKQLKNNPDVITAYPAFMIGKDIVYVSNKFHFSIKKGADLAQIKAFLKNNKSTIVEEINLGDRIQYVVAVSKGGKVFNTANSLFEGGQVEFADPDFTFTAQNHYTPTDYLFSGQWFLHQATDADIDAPEAWNLTMGSPAVTVAVIDGNGYDLAHEDMKGKFVNPYDAVNDDNDPSPENADANHGTPCAGLIGATTNNTLGVAGVGFNIKVMPVCIGFNAIGLNFSSNSTIIARAAEKVIAAPGVVAVSNSYGLGATLGASVEGSYTKMRFNSRNGLGAVVLASTMNTGLNSPTVYPAGFSDVVGVGASNNIDKRADFSNYGSLLDIVAPGVNILTVDRTGLAGSSLDNYTNFGGTSAACPITAGVVGLMASLRPGYGALNYMIGLLKSADKAGGYEYLTLAGHPYGTWNNEMGYGRVNAFRALQFIQGIPLVSGFEPVGGPVGTSVTITGKNFLGAGSVTFNGVSAQFTVVNETTIVATSPAGASSGPIYVSNAAGTGKSAGSWVLSNYCIPVIENPCSTGDYINNFSLHTLVNNGSGCNGQTSNYINYDPYESKTTVLQKGQSYTISMQAGANHSQGFGVWIDYNNDSDFSDSGEFVYKTPSAGTGVFTGTITIPSTVTAGQRRMRVRTKYFAIPAASEWCAKYTIGEVEDYTITIGYCIPEANCQLGDYINNFSFNTLVNNNTGCNMEGASVNGYINNPPTGTLTTTVSKGKTYPLKVQSGTISPQGFGVWIDYNNDNDFNDSGELVYVSPSAGTTQYSTNITIPSTVSTGQRRMRVRSRYNAAFAASESCTQFMTGGETEDYTITINEGTVTSSSQWNKRFGGSGSDNFSVVIKTSDGGYLLGGHSTSAISGDKTQASQGAQDYWIVKTDASGNKQWDKRFGGSAGDYLNTIIRTSDGGYLLGGNSQSGISGDKSQASQGGQDYWIVKISSTGAKQWDKRFGGSANDDLHTLHQLSSGEYMLTGYSASGISGDKSQASQGLTDYWVIKINSTGGKVWDKRFGGSGDDFVEASVVNSDGSIVLAGRSASGLSGDKSQASQGGRDFWVIKINSTGGKVWDKRFGGTGNEDANAMVAVSDGYLIGGISTSGVSGDKSQTSQGGQDYWVIKINSTGTKQWDKRFGGSLTEDLRSLIATSDGGFLIGGKSDSGVSGDKSQASQGGQDYWAIKITSTGTKQWDKRFGGSAAEELRTVLQTSEGGYLLAGRSDSGIGGDKSQASQGGTDYWMVKIAATGSTVSFTTEAEARVATESPEVAEESIQLKAWPNPFKGKTTIAFTLPNTELVEVKVYDIVGNEVKSLFIGEAEAGKPYEITWQTSSEKPGMYIIRIGSLSATTYTKVILLD
ncbi:S8 family serine peptidase [Rhodocytophaga rosea]|uniref:S8 family serine peptidase n=1 Tax=Rhodocytophaga rosea TaxID=2704465 RepID=A0A6C0GPJ9_9BACT|nr:GEVED domain-containing protein [Rhodocytophaga rosea]QHT69978.1 S8 family serine peptidase [Rhodocytophaga rosea]